MMNKLQYLILLEQCHIILQKSFPLFLKIANEDDQINIFESVNNEKQ